MFVVTIIVFLVTMAVAYGLAYWAFRARHDRSAYVGLYLLFGFPGLLLIVAGLAFGIDGREWGWVLLAVGLGMGLPLARQFREAVASVTPMDATSPVDMTGLCLLLTVIAYLGVSYALTPEPDESTGSVGIDDLVVQVLALAGLAYAAVGLGFHRSFREATARLGITRPTMRMVAIAIGFVVLGLIANGVASGLTQAFQPDVYDEIEEVTEDLTADVQNPLGAATLGLSAGVGEELLMRGALQPRFGIFLTSVAFSLLHVQYGFSFVLLGLFLTGALLGYERKRYGTTAAILTHAIFNTIAVLAQTYS